MVLTDNVEWLLIGLSGEYRRIDGHLTVVEATRIKFYLLERDDAVVGVFQLRTTIVGGAMQSERWNRQRVWFV